MQGCAALITTFPDMRGGRFMYWVPLLGLFWRFHSHCRITQFIPTVGLLLPYNSTVGLLWPYNPAVGLPHGRASQQNGRVSQQNGRVTSRFPTVHIYIPVEGLLLPYNLAVGSGVVFTLLFSCCNMSGCDSMAGCRRPLARKLSSRRAG